MAVDWRVSWSHQLDDGIGAIAATEMGLAVATRCVVRLVGEVGDFIWKRTFQFDVFRLVSDGKNLAVLSGSGFHLLALHSGNPLGEGRSVRGGFRDVIARPGGGWVLSDRGEHIHIFNDEGRGVRRLKPGGVRKLLGWLDREHLIVLDGVGHLRCLRLFEQHSQRVIEERVWSWASRMSSGMLLLQGGDGSIHEGVPNPFGWDSLEQVVELGVDPLSAVRTQDGWWMLTMEGELNRIPPDADLSHPAGDHIDSNHSDIIVTASRDGLVRWWESPLLTSKRSQILRKLVSEERKRIDWEKRQVIFEAARDAEESGMLSRAIELYASLGRREDVRRLLARGEAGE